MSAARSYFPDPEVVDATSPVAQSEGASTPLPLSPTSTLFATGPLTPGDRVESSATLAIPLSRTPTLNAALTSADRTSSAATLVWSQSTDNCMKYNDAGGSPQSKLAKSSADNDFKEDSRLSALSGFDEEVKLEDQSVTALATDVSLRPGYGRPQDTLRRRTSEVVVGSNLAGLKKFASSSDERLVEEALELDQMPVVQADRSNSKPEFEGGSPFASTLSRITAISNRPMGKGRKYLLLAIFSGAQFVDILVAGGVIIALADVEKALDMSPEVGTWLVNAYAISFASFLLLSGRIADMFNPKFVFISGFLIVGIFAILVGFSTNPIMLFAFRGIQGVGASLTIPSALKSIMMIFPEKDEQASALAVFSSSGALGSVLGSLLAGVLLTLSWKWMFWIIGIVAITMSAVCVFIIPSAPPKKARGQLDYLGVTLLTSGLVLLIYALTTGSSTNDWTRPNVIAPLVISVSTVLPAFFLWERKVDQAKALIPVATWRLPNFTLLFFVSLSIYGWFNSVGVPFTVLWQLPASEGGWGATALETAVRFLPFGIVGGCITIWAAICPAHFQPRYLLAPAMFLCAVGSTLMAFGDSKSRYWSLDVPGMIIGCLGGAVAYVTSNVGMMQSTGSDEMAGVVGAIFNAALQTGLTLIISIQTSIQSSTAPHYPAGSYKPIQNSFWFIVALMLAESIAVFSFFRTPLDEHGRPKGAVLHHA